MRWPRVLLIDDQPARLLSYESVLEGVGVETVRALSGPEGLERLLKQEFAVILLDVSMPDMDGFETARLIREHPRFEQTPIIFVTGVHVTQLDALKGYALGAIDYISVPIVPEILRSKVALLVELYRRRAELQQLNRDLEARSAAEREAQRLQARDARSRALVALTDEFRTLTSPSDLAFAASRILGETLQVSRCGYGTVSVEDETTLIERDWRAPGVESIAGVLHFREYGTYIDDLKRGETVVCEDAETDPRTAASAEALKAISARSFVNMPLVENGRIVAVLYLAQGTARPWTSDELTFVRDVAERTRIAVERRRSEQAVANDLHDTRLLRDLAARLVLEENASTLFDEILAAAMTITEADGGTIQLLDETARALTFVAKRGLDPQLISQSERVDAQTPLTSRAGKPLGMLSTHWHRPHQLSERERRFLDLLARQAADLMERMQAREKLRASEHQLREADRRKDEFIAVLAHELRNPLVPIRTGIELLTSARENPVLIDTIRPMMERQVGHMVRLIDDLLDVSRITSGKIELRRQHVSLTSLVTSAVEANRAAISAGQLDLSVDLEDPYRILEVDPTRFSQVIANLLQNAAKFTPPGGKIALTANIVQSPDDRDPELVIKVSDTGAGIAEELLPRLFELFAQAKESGQGRHAGLGIGLALARRLVELHGGTLRARSDGLGKGSEFTIRIPAPARSEAAVTFGRSAREALDGIRVMVVDDNRDGADAMGMLISDLGGEVSVLYDGPSALALLEEFMPDVVLLDIGMPAMDGYETCKRIRETCAMDVAVVAVTGWGQERDRRLATEAGFDAHLTKPADPVHMADLIGRLRRRH
jgi:signal transduction histidine kinase/DNA-binding response OmpR family regulator